METRKKKVFKQKDILHVIPTRSGEELRFSIVEVDGKEYGDIRYFEKGRTKDDMFATKRGIPVPKNVEEFKKGFEKLSAALAAR